MFHLKYHLFYSLLLCLNILHAQVSKKTNKQLKVAEAFYAVGEYNNSLNYYLKVTKKIDADSLRFKVSECYLKLRNYEAAVKWFKKITSLSFCPEIAFEYARCLKYQGEYKLSKQILLSQIHADSLSSGKYANFLASCDSALKWSTKTSGPTVKNIANINSSGSDVSPLIVKDKLFFSTSRESVLIKSTNGYTSEPFYNIYVSSQNKKDKWRKPAKFSGGINSKDNEVGIIFSADGNHLYFTRTTHGTYLKDHDDNKNHLKLYLSHKKTLGWSSPEYFIFNDSTYSFGQPTLGQNDKAFIFVSDMPGGYGGTDLYLCFNKDSSWTTPINLGPKINTPGNELYPFLAEDNTLYFSSDYHPGFGGYDIFKTKLTKGHWETPKNLMLPINSSYDDFSFTISKDGKKKFFSSNRKGGKGKEDIYEVLNK